VAQPAALDLLSAFLRLSWSKVGVFVLLIALSYLLFFHGLADRDLWSSHEARAAQDAQSILDNHQWGLPRLFDGKVELQKPPLYYWLVAVIARLRGGVVDEWTVRLPAACAGLGGVLLLAGLGVVGGRALAGLIAALVLATAMHYTWLGRTARIDMPLTLAVGLALGAFYLGLSCRREQRRYAAFSWFLLAYVAIALALLLKGPIGVVLAAAVAAVYLSVEGELPRLRAGRRWLCLTHELGIWWGLPLVVALTTPWFLWANVRTDGGFFDIFFWKHNVERGFGGGTLAAHPWWFYAPHLLFDFLPWSLFLPLAVGLLVRRGWWSEDAEARFGLVWLTVMVVLLSCFRFKRADYLLPAYPGAALFLGSVAGRWYRSLNHRRVLAVAFGVVVGAVSLGWWIYVDFVLPQQEPHLEFRRFAEEIRSCAPAPQLVLFFRAEAHALAFHVGRPIDTILEWENLDVWAGRPETYYVVMPPEIAEQCSTNLKSGRLVEVLRNTALCGGQHAHPLVLLRTCPGVGPAAR
jgi:4-amino-4-deoxy-L-arabinose transferase-like glycosyltransferase